MEPTERLAVGPEEDAGVQADAPPEKRGRREKRRRRLQVGEWPVTLAMVGALVGLFVAGLLVALNQAFPEGRSGGMNAGVLTGVSIAIIVGASALGVLLAGAAQLVAWGWRLVRRRKAHPSEEGVPPVGDVQEGLGDP